MPVMTRGTRAGTGNWTWNGSVDKPTLRASIKASAGDLYTCHTWLSDGELEHLGDCTCGNAGKRTPLEEIEKEVLDGLRHENER